MATSREVSRVIQFQIPSEEDVIEYWLKKRSASLEILCASLRELADLIWNIPKDSHLKNPEQVNTLYQLLNRDMWWKTNNFLKADRQLEQTLQDRKTTPPTNQTTDDNSLQVRIAALFTKKQRREQAERQTDQPAFTEDVRSKIAEHIAGIQSTVHFQETQMTIDREQLFNHLSQLNSLLRFTSHDFSQGYQPIELQP